MTSFQGALPGNPTQMSPIRAADPSATAIASTKVRLHARHMKPRLAVCNTVPHTGHRGCCASSNGSTDVTLRRATPTCERHPYSRAQSEIHLNRAPAGNDRLRPRHDRVPRSQARNVVRNHLSACIFRCRTRADLRGNTSSHGADGAPPPRGARTSDPDASSGHWHPSAASVWSAERSRDRVPWPTASMFRQVRHEADDRRPTLSPPAAR